jgi:hypothetical protein
MVDVDEACCDGDDRDLLAVPLSFRWLHVCWGPHRVSGGPCAPAAVLVQLIVVTCAIVSTTHCTTQTFVLLGECVARTPTS